MYASNSVRFFEGKMIVNRSFHFYKTFLYSDKLSDANRFFQHRVSKGVEHYFGNNFFSNKRKIHMKTFNNEYLYNASNGTKIELYKKIFIEKNMF